MRRQIGHVVLERGADVGHTWTTLYDSLVLHTGKHMSALPGMAFARSTPLFPPRLEFIDYLRQYRRSFQLPVETGADVTGVIRDADGWEVEAGGAKRRSRALVIATGVVANPHVPRLPGRERYRGRIFHSVEYQRPDGFERRCVLVVGAGNSAGEISVDLLRGGAIVTIAVRSGRRVVPRQLLGIPIQYFAVALAGLPRSAQRAITAGISGASELMRGPSGLPPPAQTRCPDVPLIGLHLADALRAGTIRLKPGITELTEAGARFDDGSDGEFDDIILATGYRAALSPLGALARTDECGFARRRNRVQSVDHPDLFFVGHNYDTRGALRNIASDAELVATILSR
jgi:putative flavoprotein involved in K+ transport